jgi:hypothetical protein
MAALPILIGSILIAFDCSIQVVSSILFATGVPLDWFQVPLATAMAAGFGWWVARHYAEGDRGRAFGVAAGISITAFLLFALLSSQLYDVSWDGQTYHAEAIAQLAAGWNPFRGQLLPPVDYPTELAFFAKGPWISAAALYRLTGSFEAGKAFHPTLMLACCLFWVAALRSLEKITRGLTCLLGVMVALNPVSTYQMHSYYVDGQLSSLLATTIALLLLIGRRGDRPLLAVLALVVILTINAKLTGALYLGIIGSGYWLWFARACKPRRAELAAWLLAGGALGGLLVGYNPYITQFAKFLITKGNAFYPHPSWRAIVSIESQGIFPGTGRFARLMLSLLAPSQVTPTPPVTIKLPLTFTWLEIKQFAYPDVRVGGFGPLFSGALLLSVAALPLLVWRDRQRLRNSSILYLLVALIGISALSFSETWWARFAPQLWLLPLLVGVVGLVVADHGRSRWLSLALILILLFNDLMIGARYVTFAFQQSRAVAQQLATLKRETKPIIVDFNDVPASRYRLGLHGIPYVEMDTLPCAQADRERIVMSEAMFCEPK